LSCHDFVDNQVRLQLFALAYNLGNFLRRLALPKPVKTWSLRTLREKLNKIGAKVVRHSRYVIFQMAEAAVPRILFREILARIKQLRFWQCLRGRDDVWNCSKSGSGMEVNGGGVPIQREKADSSRKYVAFLVFNATWGAGFLGN
jgi:hypothetical protein